MCWPLTIWCCSLAWLLAGCQTPKPRVESIRRVQPLLGTFVSITAYGSERESLNRAVSAAFEEFHRADALMSIHRTDSELSLVNARAADEAVVVSPELFLVLETALRISRESEGAFDVTIRPVADLWGFIWKRDYRFPTRPELDTAFARVGFSQVKLDAHQRTVRFLKPGLSIDLGGIGKGYAVDRAIERLKQLGVTNALVKAGGDLRVIGTPPGEPFWTVQIEDPAKSGSRTSVALRDAALSTSGDYENYFEHEGRRYSHILDARTGMPVSGIAACTVIAPTCVESDAWATACMVLGVERSLSAFEGRFQIRFVLRPEPPAAALPVRETPGFPRLR